MRKLMLRSGYLRKGRVPTVGVWVVAFLAAAVVGASAAPTGATPAGAPRPGRQPRLSIATPATGNLVAGLVQVAVAFDAGSAVRITALELWVDDLLFNSQALDSADARGTQTIDWDTLRLRNGQHSLKVRAFAGRKLVATDSAIVTVSNGGVDVVPPLVSFYAPLDGQIVSGNVNIGINAADNDQVALVGLFVNRQLKMMKSNPPFQYTLDTTTLPMLNGRGALVLEAWAYDRAQNRGMALLTRSCPSAMIVPPGGIFLHRLPARPAIRCSLDESMLQGLTLFPNLRPL